MIDWIAGFYLYFVVAYVISGMAVHFAKFDCTCEMTKSNYRLMVITVGPFLPLAVVAALAICLPFAIPVWTLVGIVVFVPPFTYIGHFFKWVARKQQEQVAQAFRDNEKQRALDYMAELDTEEEREEYKEALRHLNKYWILDEEEPKRRIVVEWASEGLNPEAVPLLESKVRELGGAAITTDIENGRTEFVGTRTIAEQLRDWAEYQPWDSPLPRFLANRIRWADFEE